jgi:hypothetical protein
MLEVIWPPGTLAMPVAWTQTLAHYKTKRPSKQWLASRALLITLSFNNIITAFDYDSILVLF